MEVISEFFVTAEGLRTKYSKKAHKRANIAMSLKLIFFIPSEHSFCQHWGYKCAYILSKIDEKSFVFMEVQLYSHGVMVSQDLTQ